MAERDVLLAIETSQREQSVAVVSGDGAVVVESVRTGDRTHEDLMPAIDRAFTKVGASPERLHAVLINAGPGGFTGLRIAHATAQAMSLACGARIVPVGAGACARMASVLAGELSSGDAVWVALASKGDESWVQRVEGTVDAIAHDGRSSEASAWSCDGVRRLIADEHLPASWRQRAAQQDVRCLPLRVGAEAVLQAGRAILALGRHVAPEAAVPVYPREAEAVRLWRQRHAAPPA